MQKKDTRKPAMKIESKYFELFTGMLIDSRNHFFFMHRNLSESGLSEKCIPRSVGHYNLRLIFWKEKMHWYRYDNSSFYNILYEKMYNKLYSNLKKQYE